MEALFLQLVSMSISASWLAAAVMVLRFAIKKAPKWMTCALWVLVAIRLVCPYSFESSFSLIPESVSSGKILESIADDYWGTTHIYHDNTDEYRVAVDAGRTPIHSGEGSYYVITGQDGISAPSTVADTVVPLLSNIWITGVTVLAVYAAASYLLIRRKVAPSVLLRENIYLCDYIESPFILGIFRPRIYLPSALDHSQWPHVLAHEQAHLHRKDHWWKPLGFALLCVYWFNPVLWLAYILLCRDIELACDERVIREMDTRQKQDYTTALLECSMPRYLVAACPLAFGEVGVRERVKTVLNYKKPAFWIILIALILCIAAAVCFLTDPVTEVSVTPGTYSVSDTLYQCSGPWPYGMAMPTLSGGTYILQDNTLYCGQYSRFLALGAMREYALSNDTLRAYLAEDPSWNAGLFLIADITDSLRLDADNNYFYLWFQTADGSTYLAAGWSNRIAHMIRLTRDEHAEEIELAWFDATVLEAQTTLLRVTPDARFWEAQYGELEVSRYWFEDSDEVCVMGLLPGDITDGDRVRIVYDGRIAETSPARINKTHSTSRLPEPEYVSYNSIEEAILDGCVTTVNSDVVAGQEHWKKFVQQSQNGIPASIRYVTYFTVGDSRQMEEALFQEEWERYPTMYVHELTFDGNEYKVRWLEGDTEYVQTWKYLMHYGTKPASEDATFQDCARYVLTDRSDVSWEDLMNGMYSADFNDQIPFKQVYSDYTYGNEPTFAELEAAKTALEPYMVEYNISSLDANEMTMRLDIGVSQWVTGLEDLIEQFVDLHFVTFFPEERVTLTDNTIPAEPILPDGFSIADILGTWEAYYYDDDLYDGKINDAFYVVDTYEIAKIRLYNDGTGLVYMKDAALKDITWKIVESDDPNTVHVTTPVIDIWYQMDPQSDAYGCMTYPVATSGFSGIMKRISDDGNPVVFRGDAQISLTYPTSTEALVTCSLLIPENCEVWTGYAFELEVYTDGQWVHYGYPSEEQAWPDALSIYYENDSGESVTLDFTLKENWTSVTDAPLPPGTYRYRRGFTFYYNGLYFSVPCYAEFTVSEDTPVEPGVHMDILNPTVFGATLAVTYKGGLMGELSTQGQYYLMVDVGNGGCTRYGLVPSQVDWEDVLYELDEGETVHIDVRWEHTAEAPLPEGIYYVELLVDQYIPCGEGTYHNIIQVSESFESLGVILD